VDEVNDVEKNADLDVEEEEAKMHASVTKKHSLLMMLAKGRMSLKVKVMVTKTRNKISRQTRLR